MAKGILAGTPTHIEYLHKKPYDKRRNKNKCKYYVKETNRCWLRSENCFGSAHCNKYREIVVQSDAKENVSAKTQQNKKIDYKKSVRFCKKGAKIEHKYLGKGIVLMVDDNTITIRFVDGKTSKFDIKTVLDKKIIKTIK